MASQRYYRYLCPSTAPSGATKASTSIDGRTWSRSETPRCTMCLQKQSALYESYQTRTSYDQETIRKGTGLSVSSYEHNTSRLISQACRHSGSNMRQRPQTSQGSSDFRRQHSCLQYFGDAPSMCVISHLLQAHQHRSSCWKLAHSSSSSTRSTRSLSLKRIKNSQIPDESKKTLLRTTMTLQTRQATKTPRTMLKSSCDMQTGDPSTVYRPAVPGFIVWTLSHPSLTSV